RDEGFDSILGNRNASPSPSESLFGGQCSGARKQPGLSRQQATHAAHSALVGMDGSTRGTVQLFLGVGGLARSFVRVARDLNADFMANVWERAESSYGFPVSWLPIRSDGCMSGSGTYGNGIASEAL